MRSRRKKGKGGSRSWCDRKKGQGLPRKHDEQKETKVHQSAKKKWGEKKKKKGGKGPAGRLRRVHQKLFLEKGKKKKKGARKGGCRALGGRKKKEGGERGKGLPGERGKLGKKEKDPSITIKLRLPAKITRGGEKKKKSRERKKKEKKTETNFLFLDPEGEREGGELPIHQFILRKKGEKESPE